MKVGEGLVSRISNPILRRRLHTFTSNRRAMVSLYIFTCLFIIGLFAGVIANDRPLLVWYDGKLFTPVLKTYLETDFGGDFELEADYHDSYLQGLIKEKGWMLWPIIPFSFDTIDYELDVPAPSPPSLRHWLGTDDQGRDVLANAIYGFRISVLFGILLTVVSSIIGVSAGAVQGYFGGALDLLFQRFIEMWSSIPTLYLIIILTSIFTPTFGLLLLILLLFRWLSLVGVVRAEFLRVRNFEFVKAARALGVGNATIIYRHILPNAMVATFTFLPFILNGSIVALTSLDFLGLGLPPGSPSLGRLLAQGKANLQAPWLGITSFVVLSTMLTLLIFVGEGVRDAFDPRRSLT
jgi:microcin C transport system permease protein